MKQRTVLALIFVASSLTSACATRSAQTRAAAPAGPAERLDMEPILIQAVQGPAGVQIESFDAQELFEQGVTALGENRFDEAIRYYDRLLASFPSSEYARPALYNRGLAHRDKKDWAKAIESFKTLPEKYPDHPDVKDALFQLGACHAEFGDWQASDAVFARLLNRTDLNADDRVEAMARQGFAQFNLADVSSAERTFRGVLDYRKKIEGEERLATDFFLAFSQYHLAQITHRQFQAVALRSPDTQMDRDLEAKAGLLLQAQRGYIDTIKYGNPAWASAAGFQVGALYEELYDSFMHVPVPAELTGEARQVYREELQKKIRVLLEKSVRWYRENLLMIERLGVNTDWADKSRLAYAKLLKLLDPSGASSPAPGPDQTDGKKSAPPTPSAPARPTPEADSATKRKIL
jgi:tetratricopeptide (TPR) repeat protein